MLDDRSFTSGRRKFLQALFSRTGRQILDHHLDLLLVLLVHDEVAIGTSNS